MNELELLRTSTSVLILLVLIVFGQFLTLKFVLQDILAELRKLNQDKEARKDMLLYSTGRKKDVTS